MNDGIVALSDLDNLISKVHPMKKTFMRRFILGFLKPQIHPQLYRGIYFTDSGRVGLDMIRGITQFDSLHELKQTYEECEITWIDAEE